MNPRHSDPRHTFIQSQSESQSQPPMNGKGNIFFKTRMCVKFRSSGTCRNGELCKFAHGNDDLRKPPPSYWNNTNSSNLEDDEKIILTRNLCRKFVFRKNCPYGNKCNFIHEQVSKYRHRDNSVITVATTAATPVDGCNQIEVNRQLGGGEGVCPTSVNKEEMVVVTPVNKAFAMKPSAQVMTVESCGLNEEVRRNKCLLKWSDFKKLNGIYGDWIDELPVGQKSSKLVES